VQPGTIELRSDTFTIPDAGMRAAMAAAEVGDDVWGEDPTVHRLEDDIAARLGKAAAVFVPSGTMGNLAAVAAQTRPGDEVIADAQAHIAIYEAGGGAAVAGIQLRLLDGPEGTPDAEMVCSAVREPNIHHPDSRLLCVENTHNRRGGAAIAPGRIAAAADAAHAAGLRVHCDGARLFNAAVALGCAAVDLVERCDTVSICLSKGLGAPVGSVVAGDAEVIAEVRRWRKRLGGGMRQVGVLAAAGLYALEHNLPRLADDHAHARLIAEAVAEAGSARVVQPATPTNMVMIDTVQDAGEVAAAAAEHRVLVTRMGPHTIRCVTHLDVSEAECVTAASTLAGLLA
jgi:threonine aldolase